ncbi:DUF4214 domain-containing protein [Pseudomonas oryzihabitans]|uniref:DUF4214 domain-containing protein n=1 Tax=Pseudomonas oryzihabitans TaxID=47885 RepID=A0A178L7J8_9PSED|nr:DUF4214 domain-containing protein [Pseudomonas oryzihabitans]OAN24873.1 hypothetical protein A4V15_07405 [Pseudomonas oryzihabitans]
MYEVTSRAAPYSSVVYLESIFPDGSRYRGSGSVVGNNDVLTAQHMVYSAKNGGNAVQVMVAPGAFVDDHTGTWSAPFGTYMATNWSNRVGNWDANGDGYVATSEAQYDMSLLGLNVNLANVTGTLNPWTGSTASFDGTVLGYPGSGTGLMGLTGTATTYRGFGAYDFSGGLGEGASGGPLLDPDGRLRGVLSSGDAGDTRSTYASLNDASNWRWYTEASINNDSMAWDSSSRPTGLGVNSGSRDGELFLQDRLSLDANHAGSLYGYGGGDVLRLSGTSIAYNWQAAGDVVTLTSNSGDLSLNLHDINLLDFRDRDLYVLTSGQAEVARLYNAAFDRTPDYGGLDYWMHSHATGVTTKAIAESFAESTEFKGLFATTSDQAYVAKLYENVLGRAGEAAGVSYWIDAIHAGATRANILNSFSDSPENQALTTGANGFILLVGQNEWA